MFNKLLTTIILSCCLVNHALANITLTKQDNVKHSKLLLSQQHETPDKYQWLVQPKACIVKKLGESCELVLNISLPSLPNATYCYFLDKSIITCFKANKPATQITVNLVKNAMLSLRKINNAKYDSSTLNTEPGQILLTQNLEIRTRQTNKKVRRVRDPWSLF